MILTIICYSLIVLCFHFISVAQSYPMPCDSMDCSLPASSVHGTFIQEYWSGLPFPSPGDLPNPGIELGSPALQANALPSEPPGKPEKSPGKFTYIQGKLFSSCQSGSTIILQIFHYSMKWKWIIIFLFSLLNQIERHSKTHEDTGFM